MPEIEHDRIAKSFFSKHWIWQIAADEPCEASIAVELSRRLPHIDPQSWSERFAVGGVYVAGRVAHLESEIRPPCRLEYYEPSVPINMLGNLYPAFSEQLVLYADDDMGVVVKPAGLPTMPARDQNCYNLWRYLCDHYERPVHTPSRLDTAVCGLVLCSFSDRMNRHFQKAYERRLIEKYYVTEVVGVPPWDQRVVDRAIARDRRHPVLRRCAELPNEGDSALTEIARLCSYQNAGGSRTLLQAEPLTGRTHQIRLHCASEGFPIIGDPYYRGLEDRELHLISYAIRMFHPYKQREMMWQLPSAMWPEWLHGVYEGTQGVPLKLRQGGSRR